MPKQQPTQYGLMVRLTEWTARACRRNLTRPVISGRRGSCLTNSERSNIFGLWKAAIIRALRSNQLACCVSILKASLR